MVPLNENFFQQTPYSAFKTLWRKYSIVLYGLLQQKTKTSPRTYRIYPFCLFLIYYINHVPINLSAKTNIFTFWTILIEH